MKIPLLTRRHTLVHRRLPLCLTAAYWFDYCESFVVLEVFNSCSCVEIFVETSPHKKHKKHKKHKHKKKHQANDDEEDTFVEVESLDEAIKPTIKLKIKLGGQTFGTKR